MSSPRVAVVLASAARPAILADAISYVDKLESVPFIKVVSVPDRDSLPEQNIGPSWIVVDGTRGLAAQRNRALRVLPPDIELVFFFDDDAIVRSDYLTHALRVFDENPGVVGLTGRVVADGKTSVEIDKGTGDHLVQQSFLRSISGRWEPGRELYGANFAIRWDSTRPVWFDERLPLYSWLEDHDYARQMLARGSLAKADDCVIVHRAAASGGRQSHVRLGYSQVMNPLYLLAKGSFPLWLTTQQLLRPVSKNLFRAVLPNEQRAWRRSRLQGNLSAARDIVQGRITPERITEL